MCSLYTLYVMVCCLYFRERWRREHCGINWVWSRPRARRQRHRKECGPLKCSCALSLNGLDLARDSHGSLGSFNEHSQCYPSTNDLLRHSTNLISWFLRFLLFAFNCVHIGNDWNYHGMTQPKAAMCCVLVLGVLNMNESPSSNWCILWWLICYVLFVSLF